MSSTDPSSDRHAARSSSAVVPSGTNLVVLRGTLSRDPVERALPSGDLVLAYELTVRPPEPARGGQQARADSVPVALFDAPAASRSLVAGDDVVVVGRVRRRFFRAGGATASRTEVLADRIVPARRTARVSAAVTAALGPLGPD